MLSGRHGDQAAAVSSPTRGLTVVSRWTAPGELAVVTVGRRSGGWAWRMQPREPCDAAAMLARRPRVAGSRAGAHRREEDRWKRHAGHGAAAAEAAGGRRSLVILAGRQRIMRRGSNCGRLRQVMIGNDHCRGSVPREPVLQQHQGYHPDDESADLQNGPEHSLASQYDAGSLSGL